MKVSQNWWSVAFQGLIPAGLTYAYWPLGDEVSDFFAIGLWLMFAFSMWSLVQANRQVKEFVDRASTRHCLKCGYNLKGVDSNCPECGWEFSVSQLSSPGAFRTRVVVLLNLACSPEAQREYQDRAPAADIQTQIFSQWEDIYHPHMPNFEIAFNESERQALEVYGQVCVSVSHRSKGLGLDEFHKLPECDRLAEAAGQALTALGEA